MATKSRAQLVLEKFGKVREDDTTTTTTDNPPAGTGDLGHTDPAAAGDGEPTETQPEVMEWLEAHTSQPEGMAAAMDGMSEMMDRYSDEDDADTYTPSDDAAKEAVYEAKGYMKQAARAMRGLKKA